MSKTIKVIDLLNMISKGEEVPEKIQWNNVIWEYNKDEKEYYSQMTKEAFFNDTSSVGLWLMGHLNDTVEIIEEEPEIDIQGIKEVGIEDIANIDGYALDRIKNKINKLIKAVKKLDNQINNK